MSLIAAAGKLYRFLPIAQFSYPRNFDCNSVVTAASILENSVDPQHNEFAV
jgi:hypothetical protein